MRRVARTVRRGGGFVVALVLCAAVLVSAPAGAQTDLVVSDRLEVIDARITGDGPWTSWLGAEAERQLLLTVENRGTTAVTPVLALRQGRGEPTTPITAPAFPPIEPGERVTVRVDIELAAFSFGTHAVVGEFVGIDDPPRFRAETTHVPWLLLALPTLVLIQVALVAARNRARRALAPATPLVAPAEPIIDLDVPADDTAEAAPFDHRLERVVRDELDAALADLLDGPADQSAFADALHRRAATATDRVARTLQIERADRPALATEITEALLARVESAALVDH